MGSSKVKYMHYVRMIYPRRNTSFVQEHVNKFGFDRQRRQDAFDDDALLKSTDAGLAAE